MMKLGGLCSPPSSFIKSSEQNTKLFSPQCLPLLCSPLNPLAFIAAKSVISRKEDYFATQRKEGETVKFVVN